MGEGTGFSPCGMLFRVATLRRTQNTYSLTVCTHRRHRHFQRLANADLLIETLLRYRGQGRFHLHGFVVMPDHIHTLITPAQDQSTSRCVQLIKGGYSFAVRAERPGEVWQAGYHDHRIRDGEDFRNQLAYIANNPERTGDDSSPHVHTHKRYAGLLDAAPSWD